LSKDRSAKHFALPNEVKSQTTNNHTQIYTYIYNIHA